MAPFGCPSFSIFPLVRCWPSSGSPSRAETVVCAFMTSKLDNCNVLFYGLPAQRLRRLQLFGDRGQNAFLPWPPHVGWSRGPRAGSGSNISLILTSL